MGLLRELLLTLDLGKAEYINQPKPDAKPTIKRGKYDGLSRKAKRRKMIMEDEAPEKDRSIAASVRSAKKSALPRKITEKEAPRAAKKKSMKVKPRRDKPGKVGGGKKSAFDSDRGAKGAGGGHEGMRAKPVKVNLSKKGSKGGKGKKR